MHSAYVYQVPVGGHIQFQAQGMYQNIRQDIYSLLVHIQVEGEDVEVLSLPREIPIRLGSCHNMAL